MIDKYTNCDGGCKYTFTANVVKKIVTQISGVTREVRTSVIGQYQCTVCMRIK